MDARAAARPRAEAGEEDVSCGLGNDEDKEVVEMEER
jgi:hypothetical protein